MLKKYFAVCWLAALLPSSILLTGCGDSKPSDSDSPDDSDALTWGTLTKYEADKSFFELLNKTYPEIALDFISYKGANRTGYSWAQMRADDIPDIFRTSQLIDRDLAKERLVDLSGYDFIGECSTSLLDQCSIDGGIYMLPTNISVYGIFYNKTLMEENGWEIPENFAELEALCAEIREAGLIPGVIPAEVTGHEFSAVFNLAKTDWLTTPDGQKWEQNFISGSASAEGMWEGTMDYVQKYIDIGMFTPDPDDRDWRTLFNEYLGERKAVFITMSATVSSTTLPNGDELGIMPYIGQDGSKNIYMYMASEYFGISKRLTEPGNEKKLENALKLLSLLYSEEGQATLINADNPCLMSVRDSAKLDKSSMIYDVQQAIREGHAFHMTYVNWDGVLGDMGQAYKEWIRGENDMDGAKCIARMDELQTGYLENRDNFYFCESTADFTLEQTARLIGKALGNAVNADAVIVPLGEFRNGVEISSGVSGKLYKGRINTDVATTILPGSNKGYAMMTMTGAQAKELVKNGFKVEKKENDEVVGTETFTYILVTKGGKELDDSASYQVAFLPGGYTEETARTYNAETKEDSIMTFVLDWLEEQKVVSPDGNPWE